MARRAITHRKALQYAKALAAHERASVRGNPWGSWRVAIVQTRARGFGEDAWIEQRAPLTVRPEDREADVKKKAAALYGVKPSDVRLRFPMEENPRKPTRKAQAFIGRKIRRLAHEGMQAPRRVAAAYSLARRAGFKVPKRARKNPEGISESRSWAAVLEIARSIKDARAKGIEIIAKTMLGQLAHGIHENPTLAVLGNPPAKVVGTLSHRLYELRYKHAEDGKDYRHPFDPGAAVKLLADGSVWITSRKRLWQDM